MRRCGWAGGEHHVAQAVGVVEGVRTGGDLSNYEGTGIMAIVVCTSSTSRMLL